MRRIYFVLALLPLYCNANVDYEKWVYAPPKHSASYCISIKESVEQARLVAKEFAAEELQTRFDKKEVMGYESLISRNNDEIVTSNYEQNLTAVSIYSKLNVVKVAEQIINNEICILVKEK